MDAIRGVTDWYEDVYTMLALVTAMTVVNFLMLIFILTRKGN